MKFSYYTVERIKRVFVLAVITSLGICFFAIVENKGFDGIHIALLIGFLLGIPVGILEEFIIVGKFRNLSLFWTIAFKGILYTIGIGIFFIGFVWLYVVIETIPYDRFIVFLKEGEFLRAVIYTLVVFDFVVVFNQYQKLLGNDVLFFYAYGKYQSPEYENRIFMFLDISSSTEIAETMDPEKYFGFINDFFHDISEPMLKTSARIYQYVGDEVVFTWKMKAGTSNNNCINLFFLIRNEIEKKKELYISRYGRVPDFKAGLHCGEVIAAVVGDLKKELIYNGDVLNTASRIRSYCNNVNRKVLVSAELLSRLQNIDDDFIIESQGVCQLKGKKNLIGLFSVEEK